MEFFVIKNNKAAFGLFLLLEVITHSTDLKDKAAYACRNFHPSLAAKLLPPSYFSTILLPQHKRAYIQTQFSCALYMDPPLTLGRVSLPFP
jgi:hypothetical protein